MIKILQKIAIFTLIEHLFNYSKYVYRFTGIVFFCFALNNIQIVLQITELYIFIPLF